MCIRDRDEYFIIHRQEQRVVLQRFAAQRHGYHEAVARALLELVTIGCGAALAIGYALFQEALLQPETVLELRAPSRLCQQELLPDAVLVEPVGDGLLAVRKARDPPIARADHGASRCVVVRTHAQQRLLPVFEAIVPTPLVFGMHAPVLGKAVVAEVHHPGVPLVGHGILRACRLCACHGEQHAHNAAEAPISNG